MKKRCFIVILALMATLAVTVVSKGAPQVTVSHPAKADPACQRIEPPQTEYAGKFLLTAYCPCAECSAHWGTQTASGNTATEGVTVAADPNILPLGTVIWIEGLGERTVQDVGGGVKGLHIDIYVTDHERCFDKAYNQSAEIYVIGQEK